MIDAHQHFWRLSRGDYPWPDESVAPILRDYGPDDLRPHLRRAGVERTILVQATATVAETEFLLKIAAECDFVAGVVGWADLSAPDALPTIDRLRRDPGLLGLRPMLQGIEDTEWILRDDVRPALAHMAGTGLRFDALVQPRHLGAIATLADRHPTLAIVIDHLAKPRMGGIARPDEAWAAGMNALARRPNVWCKLSGMVTEIGPDWREADLRPFADHMLAAFGPARVLWGSDWPVVDLAGGYDAWAAVTRSLLSGLDQAARERVFSGSAQQFYGLS